MTNARTLFQTLLLIAAIGLALPASAVVVEDLHRALVDVEDHSNAQLQAATREALSQVLVKVSGSPAVLANEQLTAALDEASRYMQRYQYLRPEDGSLKLQVHFDPQSVNDLLRNAGAPLWTANRPPLLVWLVVDDATGRHIATPDSNPELFDTLTRELERRGVPVTFPLYDLQDTLAISVQALWRLDELAVYRASQRYGVANVLVGRMTALPGERWMGDWSYLYNQDSAAGSLYGQSAQAYSGEMVDFVADRMAGRYAVAADAQALEVLVRVDDIDAFADYRTVLQYLEGIELVDDAWPAYLEGDSVVFRLAAQADAEALHRIVALNRRLQRQAQPEPLRRGPINLDLVYRWTP